MLPEKYNYKRLEVYIKNIIRHKKETNPLPFLLLIVQLRAFSSAQLYRHVLLITAIYA